jgi:hypothetical protein
MTARGADALPAARTCLLTDGAHAHVLSMRAYLLSMLAYLLSVLAVTKGEG